jgi:DNA ligase (NAD+)
LITSYSKEDLIDWEKRIEGFRRSQTVWYLWSWNTCSISITYDNGKLRNGAVTCMTVSRWWCYQNVKQYGSFLLELKGVFPNKFDIWGEIILLICSFENVNQDLIEIGETPYSSPRNTASGSSGNCRIVLRFLKRPLDCLLYFIIGDKLPSQSQF